MPNTALHWAARVDRQAATGRSGAGQGRAGVFLVVGKDGLGPSSCMARNKEGQRLSSCKVRQIRGLPDVSQGHLKGEMI